MVFAAQEKQRISGAPLERVFRELFGTAGSWFDTDRATVDQNTGKLGAFVDYMDSSHRLEQTSSSAQCAPVAPLLSGAFNGRPVATATGAQWYQSTRAAATWNYLHNGTGGAAVVVGTYATGASLTEAWCSTTGAISDAPGIYMGRANGGTELIRIGRVASTNFAFSYLPTPITSTPTAWLLSHTNTPSANILARVTGRTETVATSYTNAPTSADATTTMMLMGRNPASPSALLTGSFVAAYFFPRHLSTTDLDIVALWVRQKYGVALS